MIDTGVSDSGKGAISLAGQTGAGIVLRIYHLKYVAPYQNANFPFPRTQAVNVAALLPDAGSGAYTMAISDATTGFTKKGAIVDFSTCKELTSSALGLTTLFSGLIAGSYLF